MPRLSLLLMACLILAVKRVTAEGKAKKNCYTCTGTGNTDNLCLTAPEKVDVGAAYLPCTRPYCTIERREYTENPGVVVAITRSCEVRLPHEDGKEVTDEFTTYYWTCTSDLCNTGDGTHAPAGGGGGHDGDLGYVLVEGEDRAPTVGACALTLSSLLLLLLVLR